MAVSIAQILAGQQGQTAQQMTSFMGALNQAAEAASGIKYRQSLMENAAIEQRLGMADMVNTPAYVYNAPGASPEPRRTLLPTPVRSEESFTPATREGAPNVGTPADTVGFAQSEFGIPEHIAGAMREYKITDPIHVASFLAQLRAESGPQFSQMHEIGRGGGRHGNYYGRGYTQLTGRNNYEYYGRKLGLDLINNPDLAADPANAARIAAAYYNDRVRNYVNRDDFSAAVRRLNGPAAPQATIDQRTGYFNEYLSALESLGMDGGLASTRQVDPARADATATGGSAFGGMQQRILEHLDMFEGEDVSNEFLAGNLARQMQMEPELFGGRAVEGYLPQASTGTGVQNLTLGRLLNPENLPSTNRGLADAIMSQRAGIRADAGNRSIYGTGEDATTAYRQDAIDDVTFQNLGAMTSYIERIGEAMMPDGRMNFRQLWNGQTESGGGIPMPGDPVDFNYEKASRQNMNNVVTAYTAAKDLFESMDPRERLLFMNDPRAVRMLFSNLGILDLVQNSRNYMSSTDAQALNSLNILPWLNNLISGGEDVSNFPAYLIPYGINAQMQSLMGGGQQQPAAGGQ